MSFNISSDRRAWLASAIFAMLSTTACGTHVRDASAHDGNPFRCDVNASEVVVENATNAEEVRHWAAEALQEMSPTAGQVVPARFRLKVRVDASNKPAYWIFSPLTYTYGFLIGAPFWATLGTVTVDADLTMDVGGKRLTGIGQDTQSMKMTRFPGKSYQAAVHNAVQNAFENAHEAVKSSPVARNQ